LKKKKGMNFLQKRFFEFERSVKFRKIKQRNFLIGPLEYFVVSQELCSEIREKSEERVFNSEKKFRNLKE